MIVTPIILSGFVLIASEGRLPEPVALAPDMPAKVGDFEAVCTGIGLDARENPAWAAYPLKIEFAGRGGQYLGDVHVILSQHDVALAAVSCSGPWVLFRLPAGKYRIDASTEDKTVSSTAAVFTSGQSRVILRYPDLGGETTPAPKPAATATPSASQQLSQ